MVLTKESLHYWAGGNGDIVIDVDHFPANESGTQNCHDSLRIRFGDSADDDLLIGEKKTHQLRIKAGTTTQLLAIRNTSCVTQRQLLERYQLTHHLAEHPDDLLLVLEFSPGRNGASTERAHTDWSNAEIVVSNQGTASFSYIRSFPLHTPLEKILKAYFAGLRLPAQVIASPRVGEVIRYELAGVIKLTHHIAVALHASETSLKIPVNLQCLGGFSLEVRANDNPGWARVIVRKVRAPFEVTINVDPLVTCEAAALPSSLRKNDAAIGSALPNFVATAARNLCREILGLLQADTEENVCIDLSINLTTEVGKTLMRAVGQGDFTDTLAISRPEIVRLKKGLLTHHTEH